MSLHKLSQKSFVNGQYDRTAQNQESVSGGGVVASGLSYAKNVVSSDRGEVRKRLGTRFLKQLDRATVIIPYRMPDEDDAILLADTTNITGYKFSGNDLLPLLSVQPDADIPFPDAQTWSDGTAGAATVVNGDWTIGMSFAYGNQTPGKIMKQEHTSQTTAGGYGLSASLFPSSSNPRETAYAPQSISISNGNTAFCLQTIQFWFYNISNNGYEFKYWSNPTIMYSDDGAVWTGVQTDYTVGNYENIDYKPATTSGPPFPPYYTTRCAVTCSQVRHGVNHKYWKIVFSAGVCGSESGIKIGSVSLIDAGAATEFQQSSPYEESQLKNIKYSQDKNEMFIACEDVSPYEFVNNNGQLSLTQFTPMIGADTVWSLNGGYPAAVSLFQNRVWFGGFETNPTKVLASKFDDYTDFTVNTPLQKDDRLDLRCNQLTAKIRNIVGGQKILYCFSEDGISFIDGGSTGLLATNENIEFILKNRMPAGGSTPAFKDDVMLYSSSDGTKLYGVDFDFLVNRFQVNDLAIYAKDVTQDKVTELHYVNNESKLVYGLTESGKMFALLYEKGAYQGFFPMDFNGVVYDIAPIKVGRDYKLLMVVFRDGNWYLEEKLDCGKYIDTSTPRLTDEEKKWATYDNLDNNIALDCYQNYNEGFDASVKIIDGETLSCDTDLSSYVGKSLMFANDNEKSFTTVVLDPANGWTRVNNVLGNHSWNIIAYGDSKLVAIGASGYVATSSDGINWSEPASNANLLGHFWTSVVWADNKFVALSWDGYISTSVDGENWSVAVEKTNLGNNEWESLAYDNSKFVAIGQDGYVSVSDDGDTWSVAAQDADLTGGLWNLIVYGGSKFVASGLGGKIATSENGTDWDVITVAGLSNTGWHGLVYDGTRFVILGVGCIYATSSDGISWSNVYRSIGGAQMLQPIHFCYGNSKYYAIHYTSGTVGYTSNLDINYTLEAQRGNQTIFTKIYPEFTQFTPNLSRDSKVAVVSEGRYFNTQTPDDNGNITLPAPCHKITYGVPYEALAIIKIQTPYESIKQVAQVDVSVINTTHLEIGTAFEDTQYIEKIDDSSYYDLTRITMNDTYRVVVSDTPETTKNVILRSNKGVPFTVNAIDLYISYSNLGGD